MKDELNFKYMQLAKVFHKKNHTSIIYAYKKLQQLKDVYPKIRQEMIDLYSSFCIYFYQLKKNKIMNNYKLAINASTSAVNYILGGLAINYRQMNGNITEQNQIASIISDILQTLEGQGVNILINPYKTYVELINFKNNTDVSIKRQ